MTGWHRSHCEGGSSQEEDLSQCALFRPLPSFIPHQLSAPVAVKYGQRRIGLFSALQHYFSFYGCFQQHNCKNKTKSKRSCLILNHLVTKKNAEVPGLILCEVHILITFIPFLLVQGYPLVSHSMHFCLSVVEDPEIPSRGLCYTDSIKYWVFRVPWFCLSYHLVCTKYLFGM